MGRGDRYTDAFFKVYYMILFFLFFQIREFGLSCVPVIGAGLSIPTGLSQRNKDCKLNLYVKQIAAPPVEIRVS